MGSNEPVKKLGFTDRRGEDNSRLGEEECHIGGI
jgi:hypothetical protein